MKRQLKEYDWVTDDEIRDIAERIAKEHGWKWWGYRYGKKWLYVWENVTLFSSIKVDISNIKSTEDEK